MISKKFSWIHKVEGRWIPLTYNTHHLKSTFFGKKTILSLNDKLLDLEEFAPNLDIPSILSQEV